MKAKFPEGYGKYNEYDFDNRISYDEEADSMYIIEIGRVEINLDPNPPAIKDQGDFFGEMGLVSDNPRMATVTTLDEVKLLQLKKEDLNELIEEHPVIFQEIEEKISTYS